VLVTGLPLNIKKEVDALAAAAERNYEMANSGVSCGRVGKRLDKKRPEGQKNLEKRPKKKERKDREECRD
jgi:hypothetical protein